MLFVSRTCFNEFLLLLDVAWVNKVLLLYCCCCCHRVWLQQSRHWGTCQIHSFRGVGRDTILCRLVFDGDLWRDKKEHLVLASLGNGDFEKLCKIQLGILTHCCLRALSVQRLSDGHDPVQYVFCCLFLTSTQGIRNQFLDQWPILCLPNTAYGFHLEPPSQNEEKQTITKPFVMSWDGGHRTGHFK